MLFKKRIVTVGVSEALPKTIVEYLNNRSKEKGYEVIHVIETDKYSLFKMGDTRMIADYVKKLAEHEKTKPKEILKEVEGALKEQGFQRQDFRKFMGLIKKDVKETG